MLKSLQSTVWVWSFSSVTLFHLCMIYPTSLLFLQLCPCSDSVYNLIYTLKVKICGYKYSAKYLKNPKASVRTISPPTYDIPLHPWKRKRSPVWPTFSVLLCVFFRVWFFPLFSSIAGYVRFQRSFLSCTSSSRPSITAVGPEAKKHKKLCSFLNHRDLSQESDEDPLFQEQNKEKQPFWS